MTKVSIGRRSALGTALAVTTLACPATGQGRFPNRPVRFLIPWAPGGTLDGFMRMQAEPAFRMVRHRYRNVIGVLKCLLHNSPLQRDPVDNALSYH